MKKKISIEAFLRWALNEELCKSQPIAANPWEMIERVGALGTRVDTGHNGSQGFGFLDGTPHADALTAAAAIRALPKFSTLPEAQTPCALAGEVSELLAETDFALLKSARFNAAGLVIRCATFKNRPTWDLGKPELMPLNGSNGAAIVYGLALADPAAAPREFKRARKDAALETWVAPETRNDLAPMKAHPKRGGYDLDRVPRCMISWQCPAPFEYAEARAEYVIWRNALCWIAEVLAAGGELIEHELTAQFPPAEPWNEPAEQSAPVLKSALPVSEIPLGVQPRRAPSRAPLRYELPKEGESRRKLTLADIA